MGCEEVGDNLSLYLDGHLAPSDMNLIHDHIKICPTCRKDLSSLEETVNLLRSLEPVDIPQNLTEDILRRIESIAATKGKLSLAPRLWQRLRDHMGRTLSVAALLLITAILAVKGVSHLDVSKQIVPEEVALTDTDTSIMNGKMRLTGPDTVTPHENESNHIESDRSINLPVNRKIIQTGHLSLQVEQLDGASERLQQVVQKSGGFVQNYDMFRLDNGRACFYSIRIPSDLFTTILLDLEALGEVHEKNISGQDVTEEFVDTDARHRNLIRQEERLLSILQLSQTVEDILRVEEQLAKVRSEIEVLAGRLCYLEDQVRLSTITVEIRERAHKITSVQFPKRDLGGRIIQAITARVNSLLMGGSDLLVWFIGALPILILVTLTIAFGRWLWKRFKKSDT